MGKAKEEEQARNREVAEEKKIDLSDYEGRVTKKGLPDQRFAKGKEWLDTKVEECIANYSGPVTKSGAPDKRTKEGK